MPHLPRLRVVPLERIRRHEEIDPLRVERLSRRIGSEGIQVNPMVCVEAGEDVLVLLDGATRTESLKGLGLTHAVVQIVDPATVTLGTWHHVVRGCVPDDLLSAVARSPGLSLHDDADRPRVTPRGGTGKHVVGDGLSPNATLSKLVTGYLGRWTVTRATDPGSEAVEASFPDWAAIIEFPTLTVDDVMAAAVGNDLLPAGITRFKVPERALRLNIPLSVLEIQDQGRRQAGLEDLIEERAHEGRIRRYEEPVYILDD